MEREQELKAQYAIICPFIKFKNGNAELKILRLVPHDCFLSLGMSGSLLL